MSVAIVFEQNVTPARGDQMKARVKSFLQRLVDTATLLPSGAQGPRPISVYVADLPKKCDQCKADILSPFRFLK